MKRYARVVGIDDAPFDKFKDKGKDVLIIGTVFRGGDFMDGLISTKVRIDGSDATKKLVKMINKTKFKPQLQCIFLNGIALGGFNVIDIEELNRKTKLPVMVVIRRMPDIKAIKHTLDKIGFNKKAILIDKAGKVTKIGNIYIQIRGLSIDKARQILKVCCTRSNIPEAIRAAHIIASGVVDGESRGGA